MDLGSGGGLPGLPLALHWPLSHWVLLDSQRRRTAFLSESVGDLDLGERVRVVTARAEELSLGEQRGAFQLVVARSFGRPAVAAECAAPLLALGGRLVVSEPPDAAPTRWSEQGLAGLGMELGPAFRAAGPSFRTIHQVEPCPERFPRRTGVAGRRPLF